MVVSMCLWLIHAAASETNVRVEPLPLDVVRLSADGTVLLGRSSYDNRVFLWKGDGTVTDLQSFFALDLSAAGDRALVYRDGLGYAEVSDTGEVVYVIPSTPPLGYYVPRLLTGDGLQAIGTITYSIPGTVYEPLAVTLSEGAQLTYPPARAIFPPVDYGVFDCHFLGASHDGSITAIAGTRRKGGRFLGQVAIIGIRPEPMLFTFAEQKKLDPYLAARIQGSLSDTGDILVGGVSRVGGSDGFLWTVEHGYRPLRSIHPLRVSRDGVVAIGFDMTESSTGELGVYGLPCVAADGSLYYSTTVLINRLGGTRALKEIVREAGADFDEALHGGFDIAHRPEALTVVVPHYKITLGDPLPPSAAFSVQGPMLAARAGFRPSFRVWETYAESKSAAGNAGSQKAQRSKWRVSGVFALPSMDGGQLPPSTILRLDFGGFHFEKSLAEAEVWDQRKRFAVWKIRRDVGSSNEVVQTITAKWTRSTVSISAECRDATYAPIAYPNHIGWKGPTEQTIDLSVEFAGEGGQIAGLPMKGVALRRIVEAPKSSGKSLRLDSVSLLSSWRASAVNH